MIELIGNEVRSTDGKLVRRIGTECYGSRMSLVKGDTAECFEELDERPAFTRNEYESKVAAMVRERYREDEEAAMHRKVINAMLHPEAATLNEDGEDTVPAFVREFDQYNAFVEQCKIRAKEVLSASAPVVDDEPAATDGEEQPEKPEDSVELE